MNYTCCLIFLLDLSVDQSALPKKHCFYDRSALFSVYPVPVSEDLIRQIRELSSQFEKRRLQRVPAAVISENPRIAKRKQITPDHAVIHK